MNFFLMSFKFQFLFLVLSVLTFLSYSLYTFLIVFGLLLLWTNKAYQYFLCTRSAKWNSIVTIALM